MVLNYTANKGQKMQDLHFIVDGDLFKVSECGEWVTLVNLKNGEATGGTARMFYACDDAVQVRALTAFYISHSK